MKSIEKLESVLEKIKMIKKIELLKSNNYSEIKLFTISLDKENKSMYLS